MTTFRAHLNSLRFKLLAVIVLIIVPLVTVLLVNNHYAVQVVRNGVAQTNANLLSLYMGQIDRNLEQVDDYLYDLSQLNTDLIILENTDPAAENDYLKAKIRLNNLISNEIRYYKFIDLFFIYSEASRDLIMNQNFGASLEEREAVKASVARMLQDDKSSYSNKRWYIWKDNGNFYLFHMVKVGKVYVGAWVNAEKIMVPLSLIDFGKSGAALLATERLEPINHLDLIESQSIELKPDTGPYYLSGSSVKYMVIGESSTRGDFRLIALIPDDIILEKLPFMQRIASIISVIACLFVLLFVFFMRRIFLLPINRMLSAMRRIRDGKWETRLQEQAASTEFEMMNETFNSMIAEIHDLKIHVYEEKLNLQKAELKHLQLQINPHFFLNSLNIIYNLATVKDFALIQEMTKCLVAYFRFMFRSSSHLVSLQEELKHTENYLRIQQLRFPDCLSYRIECMEDLKGAMIPPLVVQTVVENCIKHAMSTDYPMEIRIRADASCMPDKPEAPYMRIWIVDNGPGFPEAVLQQLQTGEEPVSDQGEHIGLWNMKRRLRLLYQTDVAIRFANAASGGAEVELQLPAVMS
ncbi:sensor histidine kinase [Paenibacillus hamazuiensis]|uniref:sensor histidine kinase n=1 Tax=Paenibacillus hamazuiensis TaxID=2936508 RepID=UPI00200ECAF2|nr:histidine kinase [Paenibacillus hamazuiensis]